MTEIEHSWRWGLVLSCLAMMSVAAESSPQGVAGTQTLSAGQSNPSVRSGSPLPVNRTTSHAPPPTYEERLGASLSRIGPCGPMDFGKIFTNGLESVDRIAIYQIDPNQRLSSTADSKYQNFNIPIKTFCGSIPQQRDTLKTYGYPVLHRKTLTGAAAKEIVDVWKLLNIECKGEQKECFSPNYAIQFFAKDSIVLETYICFRCENFQAVAAGGHLGLCDFSSRDGKLEQLYDKLTGLTGLAGLTRPNFSVHQPDSSVEFIEQILGPAKLSDNFTLEERNRIGSYIGYIANGCAILLSRKRNQQPANVPDASVEFTITDKAPSTSQAPTELPGNVLGSLVTEVSVKSSLVDEEFHGCVSDWVKKLRFLPSRHGPLQLRIRTPAHALPH